MTNSKPKVSTDYLSDVTGKTPVIDFDELIKELGLKGIVPDSVKDYIDKVTEAEEDGVHQYLCHLDDLPSDRDCGTSKAIAKREKDRLVGYVQWDTNKPLQLLYLKNGRLTEVSPIALKNQPKPIPLARGRYSPKKGLRSANTASTVIGQGAIKPTGTFKTKSVTDDRTDERKRGNKAFDNAINGKDGTSIGDRAVYFNPDGSVTKSANNIRNNSIPIERSSNIPSETLSSGVVPKKIDKGSNYRTRNHPNKKKVGATNDIAAGVAALGGVAALAGILSLLMPMHFLTSAITFLTAIATFFTNVRNVVDTYLSVTDALLGIIGIKGTSKKIKEFISSILDNIFGKENVVEIKSAFASGVNSISVTTKLLEKVKQLRDNTDSKIDEARLAVGTINNALAAEGLIPPEFQESSQAIDKFVGDSKNAEEIKSDITLLTDEIKTQDESEKLLKEEEEFREKAKIQKKKDVDSISELVKTVKTNVDKIDTNKL